MFSSWKRKRNEDYDIDDPVHIRNYPKQHCDEEFELVKTRERALMRSKPCSAEIRQRVKVRLMNSPNNEDEESDVAPRVRFQLPETSERAATIQSRPTFQLKKEEQTLVE